MAKAKEHRGAYLPGVTCNKHTGRFRARLCLPGDRLKRTTTVGIFATEREAHEAYKQARKQYYPDQMDNLASPVRRPAEQQVPIPAARKKPGPKPAAAKKGGAK